VKLIAKHLEYEFSDASGYSFEVSASEIPGRGWSASVRMNCDGLLDAATAVQFLEKPVRAFLKQLAGPTDEGEA
jgi:hypothetical protein